MIEAGKIRAAQFMREFPGDLCAKCRFSTIIKGESTREIIKSCGMLGGTSRIQWDVTSCSSFMDISRQSLGEMVEIAFICEPKGGKIGFTRPSRRDQSVPPNYR